MTWSHTSHRSGPAPIHWNSPKGVCRWCGCCIFNKKGRPHFKGWHTGCAEEFKVLFWPAETRRLLIKERGRHCEKCNVELSLHQKFKKDPNGKKIPNPDWPGSGRRYLMYEVAEHHHIMPLIDYRHTIDDPWKAWRLGNLLLLCHECHMEEHRRLRKKAKSIKKFKEILNRKKQGGMIDVLV